MAVAQPLKTYVSALWQAEKTIARKLGGSDLRRLPLDQRVMLLVIDIMIAMILQALVELAVITDVQLNNKLNTITSATYPVQPMMVPMDDEDEGTVATDPDLGA